VKHSLGKVRFKEQADVLLQSLATLHNFSHKLLLVTTCKYKSYEKLALKGNRIDVLGLPITENRKAIGGACGWQRQIWQGTPRDAMRDFSLCSRCIFSAQKRNFSLKFCSTIDK
jgi:hypothetical protein